MFRPSSLSRISAMVTRRYVWFFFSYGLSFAGLVMQIYYISHQYFSYITLKQLDFTRSQIFSPPQLISCYPISCLMNEEPSPNATLKFIFENTPTAKEVLESYVIHATDSYAIEERRNDSRDLVTTKFFKHNKICYSYILRNNSFRTSFITNSYAIPRIFFIYTNGKHFVRCHYNMFYLHLATLHFHGLSNSFTENYRGLKDDKTGFGTRNKATLTYSTFKSELLEYPYDTKCKYYQQIGFESQDECIEDCMRDLSRQTFGKIPFNIKSSKPYDFPIYTKEDDKNMTFQDEYVEKVRRPCWLKCPWQDCEKYDFVPLLMNAANGSDPAVDLFASNSPEVVAHLKAKVDLIDYVTYVLSCISFWLGFSPIGFLIDNKYLKKVLGSSKNSDKRKKKVRPCNLNSLFDEFRETINNHCEKRMKRFEKMHELHTREVRFKLLSLQEEIFKLKY